MAWTKRQLVAKALTTIGYANYIYDLMPEQLQEVLVTLESMMGDWEFAGIHTGYPISDNPDKMNLDDSSNLSFGAITAVWSNLAVRISPDFGKTLSPQTQSTATISYQNLLTAAAFPRQQQLPSTMPLGAGNKPWRTPTRVFVDPPRDEITNISGDEGMGIGDVT